MLSELDTLLECPGEPGPGRRETGDRSGASGVADRRRVKTRHDSQSERHDLPDDLDGHPTFSAA